MRCQVQSAKMQERERIVKGMNEKGGEDAANWGAGAATGGREGRGKGNEGA